MFSLLENEAFPEGSRSLQESQKKSEWEQAMLTIPFIHHRSDDHRKHTTVQVKVQLREKKQGEFRQFTPGWRLAIVLASKEQSYRISSSDLQALR